MKSRTERQVDVTSLISLLKVATRVARPMRDGVADPEGLSVTELRIMLALGGEGGLAGHELADLMAMLPMNVSRALASLEKMGLVELADNVGNRRRKPFQLTALGEKKFTAMEARLQNVATFVFGGLSESDAKQATALLDQLDATLIEWASPPDVQHVARS